MRSISRLPKLEKERKATRGSWPMVRALATICLAMVASCSGEGVSLIEVSARNTVPWRATTME